MSALPMAMVTWQVRMSGNNKVRIMADGSTRVGDEPWPREVRELAFELWYLKFHRRMPLVLEYLNTLPDQYEDMDADDLTAFSRDTVVDALRNRPMKMATLYAWCRLDKWADEAERRHRELAPALFQRVDHDLEIASISAAEALIDIVKDPRVNPLTRLKAADSILDRTGHMAWTRDPENGKTPGPQRDYSGTVAGKSVEELLRQALGDGEA